MSMTGLKEFTIRHVFENIDKMELNDTIEGPIEYHYNAPWKIRMEKVSNCTNMYLDCPVSSDSTDWFICTAIDIKLNDEESDYRANNIFCHGRTSIDVAWIHRDKYHKYFVDGKLAVEMTLQIYTMIGDYEKKKLRNFDESSDKHSDVVLIVGGEKFHVNKMYLAFHCTYFDTLFFGKFAESGKTEIELKDIDPESFQHFLEFLYLEGAIEAHSVFDILHLADFFDSKTAIRRCHKFLIYKSELPLKQKFETSIKYNLEELMIKCISDIETIADLKSIVPKEAQFENAVWNELFDKALSLSTK